MNKQLTAAFPSLIVSYDLSDLDLDLVYKNINNIRREPNYLVDGSCSSYGHDFSILYNENLSFVKDQIDKCIFDYVNTCGLKPLEITGSWYTVMNRGCCVTQHRHEGSVLSGVLYVDVDEDSVPLIFLSPLMPYKMNDLYEKFDNPYSCSGMKFKPIKGGLILFPSWLEHKSDQEQGTRCIISFNTFYH